MSSLVRFPEFDHYAVSRVLGEGGMGIVFLAEDRRTNLPVAVKVMSRSLQDPELQARFMKETQILSSLNHRNIVRCYEVVRSREGLPSIVMEYLEGVDLTAFEGRPFPELIPLMVQSAMGLAYLKERAILHRDLSPNNILATLANDRRLVKIVDFGVAKVLQEGGGGDLTQTGEFLGKLAFASPELLTLSAVDFRSDIYSLGVIFFRLLTKRRPLQVQNSRNYLEWVRAHEQRVPLDFTPPEGNPPPPAPLQAIVSRMLERDPADRPQGYEEIIDSLVAVQAQAEKDGLLPDLAVVSTLPVVHAAGAAGSSGRAANSPAPPVSPEAAEAMTNALPDAAAADSAGGQPDWLASADRLEELQMISSTPKGRAGESKTGDSRNWNEAAARRRAETLRAAKDGEAAARRRRNVVIGSLAAVLVVAGGGYAAWALLLRETSLSSGPASRAAESPRNPSAPAAAIPPASERPAPVSRPATRQPVAAASALSAEARGLTTQNVVGFLPSPVASGSKGAILLVAFRRPANLTGLKAATIVEAKDRDGRPFVALSGIQAQLLPIDDPTGAGRIRLELPPEFPSGDARVAALGTIEIELGSGRIRARLDKGVLSH